MHVIFLASIFSCSLLFAGSEHAESPEQDEGVSCEFPDQWHAQVVMTEPIQRLSDDRRCHHASVAVDYNSSSMYIRAHSDGNGSNFLAGRWAFEIGLKASEDVKMKHSSCRKSGIVFLSDNSTGAIENTQRLTGLMPVPGHPGEFQAVLRSKEFAVMDSQFRHHRFKRSICTAWFLSSRIIFRVRLRGATCIPVAVLRYRDDGYACQVYKSYMKRSSNYQVRLRKGVMELVFAVRQGTFQEGSPPKKKEVEEDEEALCLDKADPDNCLDEVDDQCLSPEQMEVKASRCCGEGCEKEDADCDKAPKLDAEHRCLKLAERGP